MKKIFQFCFFVLILLKGPNNLFAQQTNSSQRYFLNVKGNVSDRNSKAPITNAKVTLSIGKLQPHTTNTNRFGNFTFDSIASISNPNFFIQIAQTGYTPFSKTYTIEANKTTYDIGSIALQRVIDTPERVVIDTMERVIRTISTTNYILDHFDSKQILPTEGAIELFYTLNPELRGKDSVESNYKIRQPDFPDTDRKTEKSFNKKFKQDKNKSNPDVSFIKKNFSGQDKNNLLTWNGSASSYSGYYNDKKINFNLYDLYKDKPEKFVFVIWKKDKYGNAILKGPEVEKRFLVYYYGSYKEGDTSLYHKADDATYGYATMWNASYKIIIIDKVLNKEMKISDPVIKTSTYFNKKDIFTLLNVHLNWIKIPIQIFD